jgi:hypothetical protein
LSRYAVRPGTIASADIQDARPHLLILMGPPNAQLLVLTYNPSTSSLIVASSTLLNPPTPSFRLAEFYRGVIVEGSTALISLWVGVLSCVELEVEKEKDLKRRRSSAVRPGMVNESASDKRLRVRETFNIKWVVLSELWARTDKQRPRTESIVTGLPYWSANTTWTDDLDALTQPT